MLLPNIDTRLEEFELPAKLVTRLKICKARTFDDIMKIDASEWTTVTPKVVNALRRFQNTYKNHYKKLIGDLTDDDATDTVDSSYMKKDTASEAPTDERRFFVANNILNAYASAGKLYGDRPVQEVIQEIIFAADAFMDAFNGKKPQDRKSRRHQRVETMVNEDKEATEAEIQPPIGEIPIVDGLIVVMDTPSKEEEPINDDIVSAPEAVAEESTVVQEDTVIDKPVVSEAVEAPAETKQEPEANIEEAPVENVAEEMKAENTPVEVEDPAHPKVTPGDIIVLTAYHGRRPSTSRNFQLGSAIKIESTHIDQTGVLQLRGFCGRKPANIDATRWEWVVCSDIEEAQALSSTIIPAPQPKAAVKTEIVRDTVTDNSESATLPEPQIEAAPTDVIEDLPAAEEEPVAEEPALPVVEEITEPVAEEPVLPVAEEATEPVAEEIALPVVEEITEPVADEPVLPVAEEATEPVAEEPVLPVAEEITEPVADGVALPVAEEATEPVADEPELPVAEEATEPVADEPVLPVVEEATEPVADEPVLPVAEEATEPVADEVAEPVAVEPELPITEEPVVPIVEEPAAVDEYPQHHRKHDMSGVPQLFNLFLTEEEEDAGLPF